MGASQGVVTAPFHNSLPLQTMRILSTPAWAHTSRISAKQSAFCKFRFFRLESGEWKPEAWKSLPIFVKKIKNTSSIWNSRNIPPSDIGDSSSTMPAGRGWWDSRHEIRLLVQLGWVSSASWVSSFCSPKVNLKLDLHRWVVPKLLQQMAKHGNGRVTHGQNSLSLRVFSGWSTSFRI